VSLFASSTSIFPVVARWWAAGECLMAMLVVCQLSSCSWSLSTLAISPLGQITKEWAHTNCMGR